MLTNESVLERFKTYMENEPATYASISRMIGLDERQAQYLLGRFFNGKRKLNTDTLERLSEFLTSRGY